MCAVRITGAEREYRRRRFLRFLGDAEKVAKYHAFELEHFLEQNSVKHCPRPAAIVSTPGEQGRIDSRSDSVVRVRVRKVFCWKCQEDEHIPVRCDTAQLWIAKNSSESENQNWILTFTKPCPKCSTRLKRTKGACT